MHLYLRTIQTLHIQIGKKGDWDFWISDLAKNPDGTFNLCGKFQWSPESPVSQIHSPHLHDGAPGIFSDHLRSVQMLKREWGAESNGKLLHLFIPSKSSTLVHEFVVEDLPLSRMATLVSQFAVKDLPLGRTHWWMISHIGRWTRNIISTVCFHFWTTFVNKKTIIER